MQVHYKTFINGYPFTGPEDTIDALEAAMERAGWMYNYKTEGWEDPQAVAGNSDKSAYKKSAA